MFSFVKNFNNPNGIAVVVQIKIRVLDFAQAQNKNMPVCFCGKNKTSAVVFSTETTI
jgi:hypothetical protein